MDESERAIPDSVEAFLLSNKRNTVANFDSSVLQFGTVGIL